MDAYREELEERVDQLERKLRRVKLLCLFLVLIFLGAIGFTFTAAVMTQRNATQARTQALQAQQMAQRARAIANQ